MDPSFSFDDGSQPSAKVQNAAWDFAGAAKEVTLEHVQQKTTSIDHKIKEQLARKELMNSRLKQWSEKHRNSETRPNPGISGSGNGVGEGSDSGEDDDSVGEEAEQDEEEAKGEYPGQVHEDRDEDSDDDTNDDVEEAGPSLRPEGSSAKQARGFAGRVKREEAREEEEADEERWGTGRTLGSRVAEGPADIASKKRAGPGGTFFSRVEGTSFSAQSFTELRLSRPLVRACEALGYIRPTPIQAACVPLAMTGRDICGSAITGSGKTAAFALPLLERLLYRPKRVPATRVLVLTPTRELAVQVHSMIEKLAQFTDIRSCLIVGGLSNKVQEAALRTAPDVVVATPGRMLDHLMNAHSVGLEDLAILVLDEADRLLEMGFSQEVQELVRMCPRQRQTLLFSATMTDEVAQLIQLSLNNPVRMSADPKTQRPASLSEEVVKLREDEEDSKEAMVLALCSRAFPRRVIIFSGRKVEAHRLKILFGLAGLRAGELHGNLTQAMRLDALEKFRREETDFLIATDVAARGLDIPGVETVINLECPRDITVYVHRVGRTARAGKRGCAVTFVGGKDRPLLKAMMRRAGAKLKSRVVAPASIAKWRSRIESLEADIADIVREEKEERTLRRAEMEAQKAENMMEHEAEIFSKPKKMWFQTPRERREAAEVAKSAKEEPVQTAKKVRTMEEVAAARKRAKLQAEREKNLPRKKRRKLEMERQDAEEEAAMAVNTDEGGEEGTGGEVLRRKRRKPPLPPPAVKPPAGTPVAELAYRRAKAAKAAERLRAAGKIRVVPQSQVRKGQEKARKVQSKGSEMRDLFQEDVKREAKKSGGAARGQAAGGPTKSGRKPGVGKRTFKSKARYKRR